MKDRFKFRVYKKSEKKMVYGVTYLNPFLLDETVAPEEAKNNVAMQCTGRKDKNGTLIYEGDVVKTWKFSTGETSNKVVAWNDLRCGCRLYTIDHYKRGVFESPQSMVNVTTIEVIGNVYENPEMLGDVINE